MPTSVICWPFGRAGQDACRGGIQDGARNVWSASRTSHIGQVESLARRKIKGFKGIGAVLTERAADACPPGAAAIVARLASLRRSRIDFIRRQQTVSL